LADWKIEFTWRDDVRQFYPLAPATYPLLLAAKPMYLFLDRILRLRTARFEYVRTETKRAIMMARIVSELLLLEAQRTGLVAFEEIPCTHVCQVLLVA
jgi:hypothetical protein